MKVNDEFLFGCSTGVFRGWGERKGIQERHAYSIMKAVEVDGHRLLLLKNPWGKGEWTGAWSDGSSQWTPEWMTKLNHRFGNDGAFWISYEDLLRKYQAFDRTRLFAGDWKVAYAWTNLNVPWTVGYHATKFSFRLARPAPVVVALSQLDGRYFRGLTGQYYFELSFRIHKAGHDEYLVRSHGNYCMRRSVCAEIDLKEAGEYHVLVQVQAWRDTNAQTVEQVIRENCKTRKDKLLRVGLAYDLAHARGRAVETEEEKASREKSEALARKKERDEARETLLKQKKTRRDLSRKRRQRERAKKTKASQKAATREARRQAREQHPKVIKESDKGGSNGTSKQSSAIVSEFSDGGNTVKVSNKASSPTNTTAHPVSDDCERCQQVHATTTSTQGPKQPEDDCAECKESFALVPDSADYSSDSSISSVDSEAIDSYIAIHKPLPSSSKHDSVCQSDEGEESEEDEFERDPWNAVAVVGLRVYAREADVSIKVLRPLTWEEGENSLDVDDLAADATRTASDAVGVDSTAKSRRGSAMGFRGRLGSVQEERGYAKEG